VSTTVTVWSDIHCPWAAVAVHRLRRAREDAGLDVVFDQRPWPLEFVNGTGTPIRIVPFEVAVLSNHEPDLFSRFRGDSWPSTLLPAFELVAAARRAQGLRVAEEVDYHLRLAFFRDSVDVSVRAGLETALTAAHDAYRGVDSVRIMAIWDHEAVRSDVMDDYERSRNLVIQGSPQIFWPDGTSTHNPGMDDHEWVRGLPRMRSTDPDAPRRLLMAALGAG
jgi:predicted DsbA family dithiol-disulfide isomerase